jgi:hypothetical protein
MKTGERLLSAVVDLQHYVKHSHDPATCAACPRWDELQQAAFAAVDALSAADLAAAAYRDRADRSAAKIHAEVEQMREALQRIADFTLLEFEGPHHMALACVETARAALAKAEACARGSDHSEEPLEMVSLAATVKESLPVDCPACGGGGLIPDPTWDWVRCELCNPRLARAALARKETT